ncbi:MAG: HEAT repeat domain-containing protein [Elusimicrobiales bacterium]|nr:HEAT repeat domain-containing protein [Elusimicrobiales bacterium]
MKNIVASVVSVLLIPCTVFGQSPVSALSTSTDTLRGSVESKDSMYQYFAIRDLIPKAMSEKDGKQKREILSEITRKTPNTKQDIDELFAVMETTEDNPTDPLIQAAQSALMNTQDSGLAPYAFKRIKKGSLSSRSTAIGMVAKLKYKAAVPELLGLVEDYGKKSLMHGDDDALGISAALALGEIGDDRAIPVLIKKLGKMDGYEAKALSKWGERVLSRLLAIARDSKDKEAVGGACNSISLMEDKKVIGELWSLLKNEKEPVRFISIVPLLKLTDASTVPSHEQVAGYLFALAQKDKRLTGDLISVAQNKGDVDYLVSMAQNKNVEHAYRTGAIIAIGELKSASAVPALKLLLTDDDREIRINAARALQRITGSEYDWSKP